MLKRPSAARTAAARPGPRRPVVCGAARAHADARPARPGSSVRRFGFPAGPARRATTIIRVGLGRKYSIRVRGFRNTTARDSQFNNLQHAKQAACRKRPSSVHPPGPAPVEGYHQWPDGAATSPKSVAWPAPLLSCEYVSLSSRRTARASASVDWALITARRKTVHLPPRSTRGSTREVRLTKASPRCLRPSCTRCWTRSSSASLASFTGRGDSDAGGRSARCGGTRRKRRMSASGGTTRSHSAPCSRRAARARATASLWSMRFRRRARPSTVRFMCRK
mmetsp:Transcript_14089/g.37921  ORF Transcript_14089/g.37921 Transcript_14089/m.37921 type:complete len:279 (+) Transcript_14089:288-1124(+)